MTISVEVVADSLSAVSRRRLTTMQLRYPKFIHGELMTHRVFSRNASSSRAIPVERLLQDVLDDPAMPTHWGRNQRGMQASSENDSAVEVRGWVGWGGAASRGREGAWLLARDNAVKAARAFASAGYHKQIVNRLLEPFCHINVVVTATEWSNFFALRCHPDAQPEMRELAELMRRAMRRSDPVLFEPGQWHLPYCPGAHGKPIGLPTGGSPPDDDAIKVSVARCARVSYFTRGGGLPTIQEDLDLYQRLVGAQPLHASPAEHQATPDELVFAAGWMRPELHGNFCGWVQYRKLLPGECQ